MYRVIPATGSNPLTRVLLVRGAPERGSRPRSGVPPVGGFSATESFTGTDGAALAAQWTTGFTGTGSTALIQGNKGRWTTGTQGGYLGAGRITRCLATLAADADISGTWTPDANEPYGLVFARGRGDGDTEFGYALLLNKSGTLRVQRVINYNGVDIGGTFSFTASSGTTYGFRLRVVGHIVQARVWSGTEPGTWNVDTADNAITEPGAVGLSVGCGNATVAHSVDFDDIVVTDGTSVPSVQVAGSGALALASTVAASKRATMAALSALGISSTGTARKVAVTAGRGSLGLASTVTARKVAPVGATSTLGVSSTATARKVAPALARAAVAVSASSTARKVAVTASTAAVGVSASSGAKKVTVAQPRAVVGLSGVAGAAKRAAVAGVAVLGLTANAVRAAGAVTARAVLALTATVTAKKVVVASARSSVALAGSAGAGKRATVVARGVLGVAGSASSKKVARPAVTSMVALSSTAAASKRAPVAASTQLGLAGTALAAKQSKASARAYLGLAGRATVTSVILDPGMTRGRISLASRAVPGALAVDRTAPVVTTVDRFRPEAVAEAREVAGLVVVERRTVEVSRG